MVVALTAGWSTSAAALPPLPPPPITLPTLTLPTVTVPPVTVPPVTTPVVTTPAVTTPTLPVPPQAPPAPRVPHVTPPTLQPPPSRPQSDSGPAGVGRSAGEANQGGGPRRAGNRPPGSVSLVTGSLTAERTESGGRRWSSSFGGRHSSNSLSSRWRPTAAASEVSVYGATGESTVFGSPTGSAANHLRPGRTGSWRERFRAVERSDARGSSSSIGRAEARSERPGEPTRARQARVSGPQTLPNHRPERSASRPGRRVRGTPHATTDCSERGSPRARSRPPKTFLSGSTSCSPSRSRCSGRRRLSRRARPWACPRRFCWAS